MERYSRIHLTNQLNRSPLSVFNLKALKQYLNIRSESGLYLLIQQLVAEKALTAIKPGLYYVTNKFPEHNLVANILVQPSYVSMETVLSQASILSQIPLVTTSVTLKKTQVRETSIGSFFYTTISPKLFFGYKLINGYLFAEPEKALIDYIYTKNKTGQRVDMDEWDFSEVNTKKVREYVNLLENVKGRNSIINILKEQTPCLPQSK